MCDSTGLFFLLHLNLPVRLPAPCPVHQIGSHSENQLKATYVQQANKLSTELIAQVLLEVALGADKLQISTILQHPLLLLHLLILCLLHIRKAPLFRDDNLLPARELVPRTAERFDDHWRVLVFAADRHDDLANVHAGDRAVRLAPGTAHASLQPISTSTAQHLVNPQHMERMHPDPQMERILPARLGNILVRTNPRSLQRLAGELFVFVRDEVAAERELVDVGAFAAQIEDSDFGIRNTTVVPRLGVRLVLAVAVAASGTATHFSTR
jgi:hypothetical protein